MRDEDERDADLLLDGLQLDLHLLAQLQVERAERLVEQEHGRPVDERACERDPLTLTPGELVRTAIAEPAETHRVEGLVDAAIALSLRNLAHLQSVGDVLRNAHVREQRVVLEHRVDVAVERR